MEEAVHRLEQSLGLVEGQRHLAPQAGLQIRHQPSGGDLMPDLRRFAAQE
jgi:hypothetical protein